MKRNFIQGKEERRALLQSGTGLPIIETQQRATVGQISGYAILTITGILFILRVPVTIVLAVGWVLLLAAVIYLGLTVTKTWRHTVRARADSQEADAALLDVLTGPHETNLATMVQRIRDLETELAQLSEVVNQHGEDMVSWEYIPVDQWPDDIRKAKAA